MIDQKELLYNYTYDARDRFNQEPLTRKDDDIIDELMKVIKSCEREKFYTIKVLNYKVIDSPIEINNILQKYEASKLIKNKSNKRKENVHDYITLKDSSIRLLIVTYFIKAEDKDETFDVYICVPRFVDKYYFKLSGNYYLPMYQIVDGSTYNNSNTASKHHSVTLKTIFQPLRIFRKFDNLKTIDGEVIETLYYTANVFSKYINAIKFILAKYGIYGTYDKLGIDFINIYNTKPDIDDDMLIFEKNSIYISVPRVLFMAEPMIQALLYTIYSCINNNVSYDTLFNIDMWVESLGGEMNKYNSFEKGLHLLNSFENGILDISTREKLKIPEDKKKDIFDVAIWMLREFSNLKVKDNLNIALKRVRLAEYIASLYAMRLSKGMHRITINDKNKFDSIRKALFTIPEFLLSSVLICNLKSYKNNVNDIDGIFTLKYSYKGISGIGERGGKSGDKTSASVSVDQRRLHPSFMGNTDPEASSNSDPGLSGMLCPYSNIKNGYFTDYQEPDFWEDEFKIILDKYKESKGIIEVMKLSDIINNTDSKNKIDEVEEDLRILTNLINPMIFVEKTSMIQPMRFLTKGGLIYE